MMGGRLRGGSSGVIFYDSYLLLWHLLHTVCLLRGQCLPILNQPVTLACLLAFHVPCLPQASGASALASALRSSQGSTRGGGAGAGSHPQLLSLAAPAGSAHQRSQSGSHILANGRLPLSPWPSSGATPGRRSTADQVAAGYAAGFLSPAGASGMGGHSILAAAGGPGGGHLGHTSDGLPSQAAWEALLLGSRQVQGGHHSLGGGTGGGHLGPANSSGQLVVAGTEQSGGLGSPPALGLMHSGSLPATPVAAAGGGGGGYGRGYTCPLAWLDLSAGDKVCHRGCQELGGVRQAHATMLMLDHKDAWQSPCGEMKHTSAHVAELELHLSSASRTGLPSPSLLHFYAH
jgi:hypothetical protein